MSDHSRRTFLKRASAGAAAVGVASVVPIGASSADAAEPAGPTHSGPFVAWVDDVASGKVTVLVGESEVVVHDAKLARQLARAAARARTNAQR